MAPPLNLKILSLTGSDKHHGTLNISALSLLTAGFSAQISDFKFLSNLPNLGLKKMEQQTPIRPSQGGNASYGL